MRIQRRRFLKFGHFASFLMLQQPKFSMEFKSLNNFERGPPKEHSCEVWMQLVLWFRRRWCLKLKVNDDGQTTDDGQKVIRIAHLEPSALGDLKSWKYFVTTGEISSFKPFLLLSKCFQKSSPTEVSEWVYIYRESVNPFPHIDAFWSLCSRWLFENIVTIEEIAQN